MKCKRISDRLGTKADMWRNKMKKIFLSCLMALAVCVPAKAMQEYLPTDPSTHLSPLQKGIKWSRRGLVGVNALLEGMSLQALKSEKEKNILGSAYLTLGAEAAVVLLGLCYVATPYISAAVHKEDVAKVAKHMLPGHIILTLTHIFPDLLHMFFCTLKTMKRAKKIAHNNKAGKNKHVNSAYAWTTFALTKGEMCGNMALRVLAEQYEKHLFKKWNDNKLSTIRHGEIMQHVNRCCWYNWNVHSFIHAGLRLLHCYAKNRYIAKLAADHGDTVSG